MAEVFSSRQFRLWVSHTAPRTKVALKVMRDGKEQKITATLGELKLDELAGQPGSRVAPQKKSDALDGVEVTDIDRQSRRQLGIPANIEGALVTAVDPTSTAAEAGLRENDVILAINRKAVRNSQEAIESSENIDADTVILLRVWSAARTGGGVTRFLTVEPERREKSQATRANDGMDWRGGQVRLGGYLPPVSAAVGAIWAAWVLIAFHRFAQSAWLASHSSPGKRARAVAMHSSTTFNWR